MNKHDEHCHSLRICVINIWTCVSLNIWNISRTTVEYFYSLYFTCIFVYRLFLIRTSDSNGPSIRQAIIRTRKVYVRCWTTVYTAENWKQRRKRFRANIRIGKHTLFSTTVYEERKNRNKRGRSTDVIRKRRFNNEETRGREVAMNLEIEEGERLIERQWVVKRSRLRATVKRVSGGVCLCENIGHTFYRQPQDLKRNESISLEKCFPWNMLLLYGWADPDISGVFEATIV